MPRIYSLTDEFNDETYKIQCVGKPACFAVRGKIKDMAKSAGYNPACVSFEIDYDVLHITGIREQDLDVFIPKISCGNNKRLIKKVLK